MPRRNVTFSLACWLACGVGCSPDFDALGAAGPLARSEGGGGAAAGAIVAGVSGAAEGGASTVGGTPTSSGSAPVAGVGGVAGDGTSASAGQGGEGAAGEPNVPPSGGQGGMTGEPGCPELAGKTLYLASDSYAQSTRLISDDFTIEAWIRKETYSVDSLWFKSDALVWADVNSQADDFALTVSNGKLALNIGQPDKLTTSKSVVATGEWVHVAATRRRSNGFVELLVNGKIEATSNASTAALNGSPTIWIGTNYNNNYFFDGEIDELRIWNRVRTWADIQDTLHRRLRGDESGLVGYYRFDQRTGNKLLDSSLSHADATVGGSRELSPSSAPICDDILGASAAAGNGG